VGRGDEGRERPSVAADSTSSVGFVFVLVAGGFSDLENKI